jgi:hypothetical protein
LIDEGDVLRLQSRNGVADQHRDAFDLLRRETLTGLRLDGNGCSRRFLRRRVERFIRRRDVHARRFDRIEPVDRALQFALDRARLVELLLKLGHSEVRAIEEFVSGAAAFDHP